MTTPRPIRGFVVAVDLGGTLTKIALADAEGALLARTRVSTRLADGPDGVVSWLAEQITAYAAEHDHLGDCVGFGVVVPGIIDTATGVVRAAPNIGWYDIPLRQRLSELTGLSGQVAHDVRSGGLAEWRLGGGAGVQNMLFLPLGTGIAGAMIVDGRMLDAGGYAGELGHIRVPVAAEILCACGGIGCLETVASASGVVRNYVKLADSGLCSDARQVADLARAGDPTALRAFAIATDALVEALTTYVTLLGPEVIIIGGGLSGSADLFFDSLAKGIAERLVFQRMPKIVGAALGADAGVIGAGLVGWDWIQRDSADQRVSE